MLVSHITRVHSLHYDINIKDMPLIPSNTDRMRRSRMELVIKVRGFWKPLKVGKTFEGSNLRCRTVSNAVKKSHTALVRVFL